MVNVMHKGKNKILVTGGCGFIGSHLVDRLIDEGHAVRVLDNLSPPAHNGKLPPWFNKKAEFIKGDVRNRKDWEKALGGVHSVFHLAAYMDIFPDFSTYFQTNAAGTALMYEVIVKNKLSVKKIVAASSQAPYGEGKYRCKDHAMIYPDMRRTQDLRKKKWEIYCPSCNSQMKPIPQKETDTLKPLSSYAVSKITLEHILFTLGKLYHIPSTALRYSIVQAARQSFRHFYSGALRYYVVQGLSGEPIVTHEDGNQLRDFVNVHDVVDAHLCVFRDNRANDEVFNVGFGKPVQVIELARTVSRVLGGKLPVRASGRFRFATARHSPMDVSKLKKLGWRPKRTLEDSVREYIEWVRQYPEAKKYLEATDRAMKEQKLIL